VGRCFLPFLIDGEKIRVDLRMGMAVVDSVSEIGNAFPESP
jgi:hypothetical protein